MTRPSRADFIKVARNGLVVAVVREMPADRMTPIDAFYALGASYLLESAEGGALGRYSFLGVEPVAKLTVRGTNCRMEDGGRDESFVTSDPLRAVADLVDARRYVGEGELSPFPGGAVGYLGYDAARLWERLPVSADKPGPGVPDALFIVTRFTLVFDNLTHSLKVICNARIGDDPETDYVEAVKGIDRIVHELERADFDRSRTRKGVAAGKPLPERPREDYEAAVAKAKELLADGEAIQVVVSQRFVADYEGDPFAVYRALRSINPSPYMFYLDFGDFVFLGASPEIMVRVGGGKALLRPIAGTRPRGSDAEADARLRAELLADEKELAEHLMLVDLARNDLGRVAAPGAVSVDRMMEVEMYSHVMHIVSEVSATLAEGVDVADVVRAVFPAGTVSGAPKIRAMEIIDSLEPSLRGPYGGLIGYFSYRGGFDSCIAIRSALFKDGKALVQAGAGIVHDSIPAKEYDETVNKAKALFVALERAEATNGPAR